MNQVLREAAQQTSHTWLVGLVTVLFMAIFIMVFFDVMGMIPAITGIFMSDSWHR